MCKVIPENLYDNVIQRLNDLSNISFGKDLDMSKSMEGMYYEAIATVISASSKKENKLILLLPSYG